MANNNVIQFFNHIKKNVKLQTEFSLKNLAELVYHAKILGYNFSPEELISTVGEKEIEIMKERKEEFNSRFSLWIPMWGKYFFMWVLEDVIGKAKIESFNTNVKSINRTGVIDFFNSIKDNICITNYLRTKSDYEIVKFAEKLKYKFTVADLTDIVWEMEIFLSKKINEKFDETFSLWKTMWGKFYFDYIIENIIKALTEEEMFKIAMNKI